MPSGENACSMGFLRACVAVLLAGSSVLITGNQQCILNEQSLNRSTHKTGCAWISGRQCREQWLTEPPPVLPLGVMVQ